MGEHKNRKYSNIPTIDGRKPSTEHARIFDGARAVGRYVLVELKAAEATSTGIVVPDTVRQGLAYVVRSVGPRAEDALGMAITEGDRVVFQGGVNLQLGKTQLALVDAASIMVVLDREAAGAFFDRPDAPAIITSFSGSV